jgi:hypothetical protein
MYENMEEENQTLPNENKNIGHNQFTKSLTSFHTKKILSKNPPQPPSTTKKSTSSKLEKSAKSKRVYLSR